MARAAVVDVMGTPKDKTFRGKQEVWTYEASDKTQKVFVFEEGKLTEILNADAAEKATHSLASSDLNTSKDRSYHCADTNQFGKFASGGGCNLYGCWPPGGYCNGFGCSSEGTCSVRGCPTKINSFRCED